MSTPLRSARGQRADAVVVAARILAAGGASALGEVATLVSQSAHCDHVTLRGPAPTQVLAESATTAPPGEGAPPKWVLDVPVRAGGALYGVLTAVARQPFTAGQADMLAAAADVIALALAADRSDAVAEAGRVVLDEEADRAQLAASLLETVGRAMATVRYAADLVSAGRADPTDLDDPVRAAIVAVRQAHRDLRAHALEAGLRAALRELADRGRADRPDDGQPPLRVSVEADDPALDEVAPPVAVTVQRVAEAALRGATGHARVCAFVHDRTVKLRVETADNAYDASELVRWARRVSALGGALREQPCGVEVSLPAQPSA